MFLSLFMVMYLYILYNFPLYKGGQVNKKWKSWLLSLCIFPGQICLPFFKEKKLYNILLNYPHKIIKIWGGCYKYRLLASGCEYTEMYLKGSFLMEINCPRDYLSKLLSKSELNNNFLLKTSCILLFLELINLPQIYQYQISFSLIGGK